jgi:microcystin-dependent protein
MLLPVPIQQFFDTAGKPLAGGLLYCRVSGTTTPQALYTDPALSVPYSNPIELDAYGRLGPVYMVQSPAYNLLLTDANGVTQPGYPADPVVAPQQQQATPDSGVPTGTFLAYGSITPPSGYLLCDGSAVSRTTYAALFAVLSTTWGAGNGSTTFNVPDFRGRTIIGAGSGSGLTPRALGATGGEETHTLTTPEIPSHTHTVNGAGGGGGALLVGVFTSGALHDQETAATGGGGAHNTMQPFGVAAYIVKT